MTSTNTRTLHHVKGFLTVAVASGVWFLGATAAFAETATVKIKGMICESCSQAVTEKLKAAPEVESVTVNVKKGMAEVAIKQGSSIADDTLKKLIADAGYTALEISRKR
jgi:copper chaperone